MKRFAPLKSGGKLCPVPKCRKPIGPSRILCRDHYSAVPRCQRYGLSLARRNRSKTMERFWAAKCIEVAGGPQ